jgi:nitroreductase
MNNEVIKSIKERKSTRVFEKKAITKAHKDILIDAALQAPSAGNLQMYSIIEIEDQSIKDQLSASCDDQAFIKNGAWILIFVTDFQRYYDSLKSQGINLKPHLGSMILATTDACIAAQNVVTAAESLGIGSCYVGDIIEQHDIHTKLLNLPNLVVPVCMLVLGYKDKEKDKGIKPVRFKKEDIVSHNTYHHKTFEELKAMFNSKYIDNADFDFEKLVQTAINKKLNSTFFEEMGNSLNKYIENYLKEEK